MSPSSATIRITKQPLVILAGWLGCKERQLRRYEELYKQANCEVITHIATPSMVFQSCFPLEPVGLPLPSAVWQQDYDLESILTIHDLALCVINEMHRSSHTPIFFHAFSNGGCFVWEHVRRLLSLGVDNDNSLAQEKEDQEILSNNEQQVRSKHNLAVLRNRLAGVIFDSCPSNELHLIDRAMAYCSNWEKLQVLRDHGTSYVFLHYPRIENRVRKRSIDYYQGLINDPLDIPQLYIYSDNDEFIPKKVIEDLISFRRKKYGHDRIWSRNWSVSRHCAHLMYHPQDYKSAVELFLNYCLESQTRPRL